ncbi:MTAP family purine nucleoside phosphorylase [Sphaerochaeta sp. UBA5836]|uniref:MTAP family purine nucleoside phosphorylase n=1 Tax=Sphaerochaeta sp. UBA5836 TaxID=1947474 RepID=UPI0025ED6702|nr:MTAP family purine nucleoside phosphorylase [Sphaerochaeta sp. UBA5836]
MKAIIGGTGVDTLDGLSLKRSMVQTRYGEVELFITDQLVFLPRHGSSHSLPPHLINYRANVAALKDLGVDEAIGIYAVGSISQALSPGEIGIVSDFVDCTGGSREHTFFNGGASGVRHCAMDDVFDASLRERMNILAPHIKDAGVYVCTNGPRLETKAEIRLYGRLGCDVVGMTLATEVSLLKEAGIRCLALAYSINWTAGVGQANVSFIGDAETAVLKEEMTQLCCKTLLSCSN